MNHKKMIIRHSSSEEKTITIRGVDKDLFDRYMTITKVFGHNAGLMFSRLIRGYNNDRLYELRHFKHLSWDKKLNLEVIRDINDLKVNKNLLSEAGEQYRFYFKDITNLSFEDDVDNEIFEKHVYLIWNCQNLKLPKNISKLLAKSLIREKIPYTYVPRNTGSITIRNVRKDIYDAFLSACKLNNQTVGDAVNELLIRANPEIELTILLIHELGGTPVEFLTLSGLEKLSVSSEDLKSVSRRKLVFHRINNLEFDENIDGTLFTEKIAGIYFCNEVKLPDNVPELIKLSRVKKDVDLDRLNH